MITITRILARQIKNILRHLFAGSTQYFQPPVVVSTGTHGLLIGCYDGLRGFEYRETTPLPACSLRATFDLFRELVGTKPDLATLVPLAEPKGGMLARWQEGGIPRSQQFEPESEFREPILLTPPETFTENPPSAVGILHESMVSAHRKSVRYATDLVRLRGKEGTIVGTDGHQLLLQSGLLLGWEDEMICQSTTVFGCKELSQNEPVLLGKSTDNFAVRTGPWTFYLAVEKERHFPQVHISIWPHTEAKTAWEISSQDSLSGRAPAAAPRR